MIELLTRDAPADGLITRQAPGARLSSYDPTSRTVEAVITTGAGVRRQDRFGAYEERLDVSAIDPAGLVGTAILDEHQRGRAAHRIGTVLSAERKNGAIVANLQISGAADVAPIRERIEDGTLTHVSIGYSVSDWKEARSGETRVRTAVAWEIHEVSIVGIPADRDARLRAFDPSDDLTNGARTRTRAAIREIARSAGMPAEWADQLIDADVDADMARARAFEEMQRRPAQTIRVLQDHTDPTAIRERRTEALYSRASGTEPKPEAREFMSDSLKDIARASVEAAGISTRGMSTDDIFTRAHGTTDFPELLMGVSRRSLLTSYKRAESPLKALARRVTLNDFRPASRLKLSDVGPLRKLSEHGEITNTSRSEVKEGIALDTYASMFSLTRKALVNDDLGAFNDWSTAAGRAAAETETGVLVSLFAGDGPKLAEDGKSLFHASRGNVIADWDMAGVDFLDAGRRHLRKVKGLDGRTPINARPKYLLVSPDLETDLEQVLARLYPTTVSDVNPFSEKLSLLVEPRFEGRTFYLFSDPADVTNFEYGYLASAPGPQIDSKPGWSSLGTEFRIYLDFGAGAVDWRGAVKFPS